MKILAAGATGATGRLLAEQLLFHGHRIVAIVRSPGRLPEYVSQHQNCSVIKANLMELSEAELSEHLSSCEAVVSCLGHTPNIRGIYGRPRKLVTETTRRICGSIKRTTATKPVKIILMNSAGVRNNDAAEQISFGQKLVVGFLRLLLPPHVDNEQAAEVLRKDIGQNDPDIEWVAVRPDTLINEDTVSNYEIYPSPVRSAIFDPGKTSRINVAHFMAQLLTDEEAWQQWKGKMPVIYNKE